MFCLFNLVGVSPHVISNTTFFHQLYDQATIFLNENVILLTDASPINKKKHKLEAYNVLLAKKYCSKPKHINDVSLE